MKKSLIAGAIACAFTPAFAEEVSTFDLGTVVVTPSRHAEPLTQTLQSTTVIAREDIEGAGQQTLPELLQTKGGVEIGVNGGPGQVSSIFIRGANSGHTVVLVDGVRLDNITSGTTALEHIPLTQIERIEILRGPGSSLYGADAIGGVIQIFTRRPVGSGFDASLGVGSDQMGRASLGLWQRWGGTQLNLRLAHESVNAPSATNDRATTWVYNADRDPYRNTSLNAALRHDVDARTSLGLTVFAAEGVAHFDAGTPGDALKKERVQSVSAYSRKRLTDDWASLLRLAQGVDDYRWINVNYAPVTSTQDQLTWQNDITLGRGARLTAGVEYVAQKLSSGTPYDRTRRHIASGFAIYRLDTGPHAMQLSLRHDENSQFGGHTTGGIGYGYRVSPAWRVTANLGTAFHAPTFDQLYYPNSANPDLKPEKSTGEEIAVHYAEAGREVSLTGFANRIRDLIAFDQKVKKPTCPWGCPVNVARARTQGVELAASLPLASQWRAVARATIQEAVNADSGRRLARRAEYYGSLGLNWKSGPWQVGAEVVGSGDRFDSINEDPSSHLPGYGFLNLRAAYAIDRTLTLAGRWDNVFDRTYELVKGYPARGSTVFVELRYLPR
ncbi:TonB-dependent receptor domain-containing protein [Thiobacter aerophilum]|uniref:TonB-dependent receptor n=1 Tax=Thiobacter aerophilum TaxID=3121275 RepID=A0ABV0ECL8_9BURK